MATAVLLAAFVGAWPFLLAFPPSAVLFLAVTALFAPAAGAFAGGIGLGRAKSLALLPPAAWMILLGLAQSLGARALPNPVGAAAAWSALYVLGWGLGSLLDRQRRPSPGLAFVRGGRVLLLTVLVSGLPFLRLLLPSLQIAPEIAARLLDVSPLSLVVECGGVDWLRQPLVYEWSGGADIGPLLRTPYSAVLAAPGALVVGCALIWIGRHRSMDA
ncbi:MAG: hypothetical protein AAF368_07415 [Planctomycetota bacterium]